MTHFCHYRVDVNRHCTLILCCTCHHRGTQVAAITPVGVSLRMLWNGWVRLSPDWYTLWGCPECLKKGKLPTIGDDDLFFATTKPTVMIEVKVHGFAYRRGRRRNHGQEDATQGELRQLQAWT